MSVTYSGLHPTLRTIVKNLPRVSRQLGLRYRVTSAYRSPTKQARLYKQYLAGQTPYVVAPPGSSLHEKGLAIDVVSDNMPEIVSLLTSAGLSWGGEGDPVHFSLKASPRSKAGAFSSYSEEVGSAIPKWMTYLPGLGKIAGIAKNPLDVIKGGLNALLDAALGPF